MSDATTPDPLGERLRRELRASDAPLGPSGAGAASAADDARRRGRVRRTRRRAAVGSLLAVLVLAATVSALALVPGGDEQGTDVIVGSPDAPGPTSSTVPPGAPSTTVVEDGTVPVDGTADGPPRSALPAPSDMDAAVEAQQAVEEAQGLAVPAVLSTGACGAVTTVAVNAGATGSTTYRLVGPGAGEVRDLPLEIRRLDPVAADPTGPTDAVLRFTAASPSDTTSGRRALSLSAELVCGDPGLGPFLDVRVNAADGVEGRTGWEVTGVTGVDGGWLS